MNTKYTGAEPIFDDPNSPYNGMSTAELIKLYDEQVAKDKADRALRKLDPRARDALNKQLTAPPKDDILDHTRQEPSSLDSWPFGSNRDLSHGS